GFGASAVVYGARYRPSGKVVAVKVIELDAFERHQIDELRRETQVMSLSRHPNLLRVSASFVHDSHLYLVTPYVSGGSCLDIMKHAFPQGLEEAVIGIIGRQTLQGLEYLHRHGHIHRDVKAGNLLVDEQGTVMLAD
ncbi:kinase-like domain-containing protein, partial [Piptocephalis cylindrospora]